MLKTGNRPAVKNGKQVWAICTPPPPLPPSLPPLPMSYSEAKAILRNSFRMEWRQCLDIGTEEDSIHQLDRAAQVTIFRLSIGLCQLLSHLRGLKISHSDECPWGTSPQTLNHVLQSCSTIAALRCQMWPSLVDAHKTLWGPVKTLGQTADFALLDWKSSIAGNAEEEGT